MKWPGTRMIAATLGFSWAVSMHGLPELANNANFAGAIRVQPSGLGTASITHSTMRSLTKLPLVFPANVSH
jgi:hypothetical protein